MFREGISILLRNFLQAIPKLLSALSGGTHLSSPQKMCTFFHDTDSAKFSLRIVNNNSGVEPPDRATQQISQLIHMVKEIFLQSYPID
jgi:hypothetical protein